MFKVKSEVGNSLLKSATKKCLHEWKHRDWFTARCKPLFTLSKRLDFAKNQIKEAALFDK